MEKRVILAVDDEKDNHEFVRSVLEDDHIEVVSAYDGEEGLKKAKEIIPDLIILDVQMPKMDGFETFRRLKTDEKTNDIAVIMLTGIAEKRGIRFSKEEMKDFFGKEPEAYVEKPIDPDILLTTVKKYI